MELRVGQRWKLVGSGLALEYEITEIKEEECKDRHPPKHVHLVSDGWPGWDTQSSMLADKSWKLIEDVPARAPVMVHGERDLVTGLQSVRCTKCNAIFWDWDDGRVPCPVCQPSAVVPAYLRKPTGNFRADEVIKKIEVSMNDLTMQKTIEKFKRDVAAAADIPRSRIFDTPRDHAKRTGGDLSGFTARAAVPDAVAGCRLGCACKVHRPAKPEPYVPAIDDWDLLPDAGR